MSLPNLAPLGLRPKFSYLNCSVPIEDEYAIPQRFWRYRSTAVGGHDTSTAGVDESFVLRHDRMYVLTIRLTEEEWVEQFEPMMLTLWAQAQAFSMWTDADDDTTERTVRLVSPWMGEGIEPQETEYAGVLQVEITVRTDEGEAFAYPYYPSLA